MIRIGICLARTVPISQWKRSRPAVRSRSSCTLYTRSNAAETRRWARERGFKSLIVVTSNYHMPRAIAEMSHAMPDVTLIPFAVPN